MSPAAESPEWLAPRLASLSPPRPSDAPPAESEGWKPLWPFQVPNSAGFNRGWARIGWTDTALVYDWYFVATGPANRARRLNERTYELGDVGEIFINRADTDRYVEIHVTPENQRLQLAWSDSGFAAAQRGEKSLEAFMVDRTDWVQSAVAIAPGHWSGRTIVPAGVLLPAGAGFHSGLELLTSVCRYDYTHGPEPLLSSTARMRTSSFHHRPDWLKLRLQP